MFQLVGMGAQIHGRNLAVLDLERGGLKLAVRLQCDKTRQAVDENGPDKLRAVFPEQRRQISMNSHDGVEADNWSYRSGPLAAAVRVNADIGGQHRAQRI